MVADVVIMVDQPNSDISYLVPVTAIAAGPERGRGYVYIYDDGTSTVMKTEITVKGVDDNRVLITHGIESGDVIASSGVSFLHDGQTVNLLAERDQDSKSSGGVLTW